MQLDPNLTSIILAVIGLIGLIIQGVILIRTGRLVVTTDSTHNLVNGQQAAIVTAAQTLSTAAGYAAGVAAAQVAPATPAQADPAAAVDPAVAPGP